MWTERDDKEIEYGKWNDYTAEATLAEEDKVHPPAKIEEIWPHWGEGIPTKLRRSYLTDRFIKFAEHSSSDNKFLGAVHHRRRYTCSTIELEWNDMYMLPLLKENYHLLPGNYTSQWSGVYRIFSPNTTIDRCCGKDPTGTLYLGLAGTGPGNWSNLRTRIMSIVKEQHHAMNNWSFCDLIRRKFPWESLAVHWAYTGKRSNYKGEPIAEATMAEAWLLDCYNYSFGELPPWNQKG